MVSQTKQTSLRQAPVYAYATSRVECKKIIVWCSEKHRKVDSLLQFIYSKKTKSGTNSGMEKLHKTPKKTITEFDKIDCNSFGFFFRL